MKPIIGILAAVDNELVTSVPHKYIEAIEGSGGLPLVLPCVVGEESINDFVKLCDGFLFTGGVDISPTRYGEDKKPTCGDIQPNRDELEFKVFEKVLQTDKPVLAICRGAQLVNVALGGTLHQDLPSEIDSPVAHRQTEGALDYSHHVNVVENTPLHSLVGAERIRANSFHHQAVKRLGMGLKIMATADDGVVEAIYHEQKRYLRAYQWHPERLFNKDEFNRKIFFDFVINCKKYEENNCR